MLHYTHSPPLHSPPLPSNHTTHLALGSLLQSFLQCLHLSLQSAHMILCTVPLTCQLHLNIHTQTITTSNRQSTSFILKSLKPFLLVLPVAWVTIYCLQQKTQEAYLELCVCPLQLSELLL